MYVYVQFNIIKEPAESEKMEKNGENENENIIGEKTAFIFNDMQQM